METLPAPSVENALPMPSVLPSEAETPPVPPVKAVKKAKAVKTPPVPPVVEWDKLPLMLNEDEVSVVAGVSVSFLRKSRCEGCKKPTLETRDEEESAPPFIKLGPKRVKYPTKDLQKWVAGLTRKRVI
jgi:hypothetical protein